VSLADCPADDSLLKPGQRKNKHRFSPTPYSQQLPSFCLPTPTRFSCHLPSLSAYVLSVLLVLTGVRVVNASRGGGTGG
jgi:hypothetical protein